MTQSKYQRQQRYKASAKGQAAQARARQKYLASPKGQATKARYDTSQLRRDQHTRSHLRRFHGMTPEDWARLFDAQDGRCYLCGCELDPDAQRGGPGDPHVDHLHDHCGPDKSCAACRRGIACARCNHIVGKAGDDPDLLLLIAASLAAANEQARARIAAVTVQDRLFD